MIDKYINYDIAIEKMLKAKKDNELTLVSLKAQLNELNESMGNIPAIVYDREKVQTSAKDDAYANLIIKQQLLGEKIATLENELKEINKAWQHLTEDEKRILYEFFQAGYYKSQDAVDVLCEVYGYERSKIYMMRRESVKRFKCLIFG